MNPALACLALVSAASLGVAIGWIARGQHPCAQWLAGYAEGYRAGRSEVCNNNEHELHS